MTNTNTTATSNPQIMDAQAQSERKLAMIVYVLQGLGFIIGLTFIAAIVINFLKKNEMTTNLAKSHMSWQLRTGVWSAGWSILGIILSVIAIGYIVIAINVIWTLYRVIRGAMALNEDKVIGKQFQALETSQ